MDFLKHLPSPIAPTFSEALRIDTRPAPGFSFPARSACQCRLMRATGDYADRNGLSGSAHVGRLELVAIAGEHAHVTPRRNRTVVSCEKS